MASSLGNSTIPSPFATVIEENILSHFTHDWSDRLNLEEIFLLIDGALPFEVCLYYQVLPLSIEETVLHLGAVSPDDDTALSYVSRMVSYLNYSIAIHPITSEALQTILSNYLKQTGSQPTKLVKQREVLQRHPIDESAPKSAPKSAPIAPQVDRPPATSPTASTSSAATQAATVDSIHNPTPVEREPLSQPEALMQSELLQGSDRTHYDTTIELNTGLDTTFIEPQDDEGELETEAEIDDLELANGTTVAINLIDLIATRTVEPSHLGGNSHRRNSHKNSAIAKSLASTEQSSTKQSSTKQSSTEQSSTEQLSSNLSSNTAGIMLSLMPALPQLNLNIEQFSQSAAELKQLPPLDMLRELLARILEGGIGRLYFECHEHFGKILWSQDGVVKSALNDLPLDTLQDVIDELKQLAQLPILPTLETQQPEVEYQYEQTRVLLRFRFMRNDYGEEATVQVLKGAALKFYQQQQLVRLERDAVTIAKQLQIKLHEIRDRVHTQSELAAARFEILPELSRVLQNIDAQLSELGLD